MEVTEHYDSNLTDRQWEIALLSKRSVHLGGTDEGGPARWQVDKITQVVLGSPIGGVGSYPYIRVPATAPAMPGRWWQAERATRATSWRSAVHKLSRFE